MKNYRADVDLEPAGDGTRIRWVSAFDPKLPGTGALLRRGLDGFVSKLANGLAEHASSRAQVAG
jgi:carbon monoxide dehydrogenase subunit G